MQLDANGDEYGTLDPVSVTLDNATTSAYSLVNIVAADRKGLFYDLMRTLKDIHLRVAYAKVPPPMKRQSVAVCMRLVCTGPAGSTALHYAWFSMLCVDMHCACPQVDVRDDGMCEADLFVQEVDGGRIRNTCAPAVALLPGRCCAETAEAIRNHRLPARQL